MASVVCRQLGYPGVIRTFRGNEVPPGYGPIWLSFPDCTGEEQNITSCFLWKWGDNDCKHYENIGVECQTTGKATMVNIICLMYACEGNSESCITFVFLKVSMFSETKSKIQMEKMYDMHALRYLSLRTNSIQQHV